MAARWAPSGAQISLMGFAGIITVGTLLLSLPFAQIGPRHHWVDDLFTATSAVCVTGLTTIDLGTSYSPAGMAVVALLIQVGGLGYMTLYSLGLILAGRRLSMRDRLDLQEATDQPGLSGLVVHVRGVLSIMLAVEALGTLALATQTVPELGFARGLGQAAFFAVCAPNNAGFSMYPDGLARWQANPVFLLTLSALIIFGGLGYNVVRELVNRIVHRKRPDPRWEPLVRIVVGFTAILLVGATVAIWAFERGNPHTLAPMAPGVQWLNAFFMAVQTRTSGFNSVDTASMTHPSWLLMLPLMFIGTGPGGTGGGLKLTTVAVLLATTWAVLRGQADVTLPGVRRRVGEAAVHRAIAALVLSVGLVGLATATISAIDHLPTLPVLFEVVSGFATAGLSVGVSPQLGDAGKLILAAMMLAGRIGPYMLMVAIVPHKAPSAVRYAEEPLMVG